MGSGRGWVEKDEQGNITVHAPPATVWVSTKGPIDHTLPLAYLDTCLVSGLAEGDLRAAEHEGLRRILVAHKASRISLVTSHVTKEELTGMSAEKQARHETIYALLIDVPEVEEARTDSGLTLTGVGGGRRDEAEFGTLKTLLPDLNDARHVFQAIRNGVDYFVTDDERTIVSRADGVEARFPSIKIRLPSQLARDLSL